MTFPVLFHVVTSGAVAGAPPEYSASEIGDVDSTTLEVMFNEAVNSPTADYVSGVTIKVNAVSVTISSGTRQADHRFVYYVVTPKVDINDAITFEYDDNFGDIEAEDDATPMLDVSAQSATNYVGSHFYFDEEWDSAHVVHI